MGRSELIAFALLVIQVYHQTAAVAELWPGTCRLARDGFDLRLAVRVQGVVDGLRDLDFLIIVGHAELDAPQQRIDTGRLAPGGTGGWDVSVVNDPAHLGQRRVFVEPV